TGLHASLFRSVIPPCRQVLGLRGLGSRITARVISQIARKTEPPQALPIVLQSGVIPQLRDISSQSAGTHYVRRHVSSVHEHSNTARMEVPMIQALQPPVNPPYKIKQSLIIAQSAEMRVIDQTLDPGEAVPWHLHPESDDYIICLRGELEVREINPEKVTTL